MSRQNHYEVLGLKANATAEAIKEKYNLLREDYLKASASEDAIKKFRQQIEAYLVLSDEKARSAYDASLKIQARSSMFAKPSVDLSQPVLAIPIFDAPKSSAKKDTHEQKEFSYYKVSAGTGVTTERIKDVFNKYLKNKLGLTQQEAEKLGYQFTTHRGNVLIRLPSKAAFDDLTSYMRATGAISGVPTQMASEEIKRFKPALENTSQSAQSSPTALRSI